MRKLLTFLLSLLLLLLLGLAMSASAATAKAVTMRVELVEGSVTIKDASGVTLEFFEGMQLHSGYSVETGDDSSAYISLDDDKAIRLDWGTAVTIKKSGRKLQVKLKAGQIVFNVTTPLAGDEALEIRTSTMITGVRGSSGIVSLREVQYITGHGVVYNASSLSDGANSAPPIPIRGGQRYEAESDSAEALALEDIPSVYLEEAAGNEQLQQDISEEGNFDVEDLVAAIPEKQAEEAARREETKETAQREGAKETETLPSDTQNTNSIDPAFKRDGSDDGQSAAGSSALDRPFIPENPTVPDLPVIPDEPDAPDEPDEPIMYTITWKIGDETVTQEVEEGDMPSYSGEVPATEADAQYNYAFAGWTPDIVDAADDATYTAAFTKTLRSYTITWKNDDGSVIDTSSVPYGTVPTHADPSKDATAEYSYTFAGWSPAPASVAGEATYTATYSQNAKTFTIQWMNGETEFRNDTYDFGIPVADPGIPERTGYTFLGWDNEIPETMPAEDLTFHAVWTISKYSVTFVDEDGSTILLPAAEYEYGTSADDIEKPDDPTKEEDDDHIYSFAGWDPMPVKVTDTATYKATYTPTEKLTLSISLTQGAEITIITDTREDGDFSGEGVKFTSESEKLTMKVAPGTWVEVNCEADEYYTFLGSDSLLIDGVTCDNGTVFQVTKDVEISSSKAYYRITNVESLTNGPEMDSVIDSNLTIDSAVAISLNRNVTIMPGVTLNINNEGAVLTVGEGVTLTVNGTLTNTGTIINNGTIVNNGTISNDGTITNNGTIHNYSDNTIVNNGQLFNIGTLNNGAAGDTPMDGRIVNGSSGFLSNCGTLASHTSGSRIENAGVFLPKASNDTASIFTYVGEFENAVTGDGTVAENGGLCNDDGSDVTWYLTDAETAGKYVLHITGAGAIQDYEYTGTDGSGGTANYIVESPWWDMKDDITELDLGNQITGIGAFAFAHSKITSLTVPSGVKYLGSYSFYKSPALSSLTIGSGVTEIRDHAFSDCDSLTTLVVPDNVTSIGASAFYSAMLQTVEIGSGVTNIGYWAFAYCTNMTVLTLSEGLVSISDHAFLNCWKLPSVSIPASVQNIDDEAFCDCNQLNKANFVNPPTLGSDVFKNTPESFCIYYPDNNPNWVITDGKWNGYKAETYPTTK